MTPSAAGGPPTAMPGKVMSMPCFLKMPASAPSQALPEPMVVVPLRIRDKVVGVISVWDFLAQKTALADVDYELFNLLGGHAAFALQGAKLNAELGYHSKCPSASGRPRMLIAP